MTTVSVIIAAYQAADFIAEAVQSVLQQEMAKGYRLELIVGVDACAETWRSKVLSFISGKCSIGDLWVAYLRRKLGISVLLLAIDIAMYMAYMVHF